MSKNAAVALKSVFGALIAVYLLTGCDDLQPDTSVSPQNTPAASIPSPETVIKEFYEVIAPKIENDSDPEIEPFFSSMIESSDFEEIRKDNKSLLTTLLMKPPVDEAQMRKAMLDSSAKFPLEQLVQMSSQQRERQQVMQAFIDHQHSIINKGEGLDLVTTHIKEKKQLTAIVDAVLTLKNGDTYTETFRLIRMGGKNEWKKTLRLKEEYWDENWKIVMMNKKEMYEKGYMKTH